MPIPYSILGASSILLPWIMPPETPWDFSNEYVSPNGLYKLRFSSLGEIGMGAPLAGYCFLETGGHEYNINGSFGGPAVWNEVSNKAAIPCWTEDRSQRMGIIDIDTMELWISKREFGVIQLQRFANNIIYGIDSPAYQRRNIVFDVLLEEMKQRVGII